MKLTLKIFFVLLALNLSGLQAADPSSFRVRVAVLRNAPSVEEALRTLCEHEYQDTVQIVKNKSNTYDAINILDVEDFLLGVVGREMKPSSPLEALKAQAIAARSHALYQTVISEDAPYDLVANLSQAYMGKGKLHKNVVLAIESTRGQVLYFDAKPIPAYFHASCGGHTETVDSVWKMANGTKWPANVSCPICAKSGGSKWTLNLSLATFCRVMNRSGYKVGPNPFIRIAEKASGGHALTLAIRSELGEISIPAEKLRSIIGYNNLKSTLFQVSRPSNPDGTPGDYLTFQGDGYGHGVGLCQLGAQGMAEHGATCEAILNHYFPKVRILPYEVSALASNASIKPTAVSVKPMATASTF